MTRVVVAGALANRPGNGGGAAVRMTWVKGLERLGCDVWFVEQLARQAAGEEAVRFFLDVTRDHALGRRSALIDDRARRLAGAGANELDEAVTRADLLVNLSGHLRLPELRRRFPHRAYVDLDPGFTQFWHAAGLDVGLADHDTYFTVGLNVGQPGCAVPAGAFAWRVLPPPVLLEARSATSSRTFTTVASWRGTYGRVEHGARVYGAKAHEFRKLLDLPARTGESFELALRIDAADRADIETLRAHRWNLVDPLCVASDPRSYRRYIRDSGAEFSVAQGVYVDTASGWLSDRTVRYLAAGKPAVVQDTGLAGHLPLGRGFLVFADLDGAVEAVRRVRAEPVAHGDWARQIAAEYFDSDRVLARFLDQALTPAWSVA